MLDNRYPADWYEAAHAIGDDCVAAIFNDKDHEAIFRGMTSRSCTIASPYKQFEYEWETLLDIRHTLIIDKYLGNWTKTLNDRQRLGIDPSFVCTTHNELPSNMSEIHFLQYLADYVWRKIANRRADCQRYQFRLSSTVYLYVENLDVDKIPGAVPMHFKFRLKFRIEHGFNSKS